MTAPSAADIIRLLDLKPHPEGGHYRETFRDPRILEGGRAASTAIHFLLALWAVYERRTFRLPPAELLRIVLGFTLPILLIGHAVSTRLAYDLFGLSSDYARVVGNLWASDSQGRQLGLLAPGWLHGCLGLHFVLNRRPLYRKLRFVLFAARGSSDHAANPAGVMSTLAPTAAAATSTGGASPQVVVRGSERRARRPRNAGVAQTSAIITFCSQFSSKPAEVSRADTI